MRAVIFDIGRVLVDWDFQSVLVGLSEVSQADKPVLAALLQAAGPDLDTGRMNAEALHRHLVVRAGTSPDWHRFYLACCQGLARREEPLAYALSLTRRPDVRVGVISNTNLVHVSWLYDNLPELVAFDAVILSCQVGLRKPEPAIFRLALEQLGLEAGQALFIDDLAENVAGAQAMWMAGIVHQDWTTTRTSLEAWLAGWASCDLPDLTTDQGSDA